MSIYSSECDLTGKRTIPGVGMFIHQSPKITKPLRAKAAREYPPGFFSAPVREWKQMRFEPSIRVRPDGKFFTPWQATGVKA